MCIVLHSFFVMAQKMMGMQHARFCMCGNTLSSVPICHPSKHASAMLGLVTCLLLLHAMTCICAQHLGPALGQERHQGADCGRQLLPGVERAGPKRAGDRSDTNTVSLVDLRRNKAFRTTKHSQLARCSAPCATHACAAWEGLLGNPLLTWPPSPHLPSPLIPMAGALSLLQRLGCCPLGPDPGRADCWLAGQGHRIVCAVLWLPR